MPRDPNGRTQLLRLPAMRRTDAPGLGRTNQQVRRNVPQLRCLLTPKIRRRRQPTKTRMMGPHDDDHRRMSSLRKCRPSQARRPADLDPMHSSPRGWPDHRGLSEISSRRSSCGDGRPRPSRRSKAPQALLAISPTPYILIFIHVCGLRYPQLKITMKTKKPSASPRPRAEKGRRKCSSPVILTAPSGTGTIEGQAHAADLPPHQASRPQASGSRKDSRHPTAACLRINAQPRWRFFLVVASWTALTSPSGSVEIIVKPTQAPRRILRGGVKAEVASLARDSAASG